jgi:hypothetical protein
MTECDWLACSYTHELYQDLLICGLSRRKVLLLATAFFRRVWRFLDQEATRVAVEVAESYADGLVHPDEVLAVWTNAEYETAERLWLGPIAFDVCDCDYCMSRQEALWDQHGGASSAVRSAVGSPEWVAARAAFYARDLAVWAGPMTERQLRAVEERREQYSLFRDVLSPAADEARRRPILPRRNDTVRKLAPAIYAERSFTDLPILADALEDAGCDDPDMLAHCRGPGAHVRGCWVVDLLLDKE